jgi:hypothetical protein
MTGILLLGIICCFQFSDLLSTYRVNSSGNYKRECFGGTSSVFLFSSECTAEQHQLILLVIALALIIVIVIVIVIELASHCTVLYLLYW